MSESLNPYYHDRLKAKASGLPASPGIYEFYDREGRILYVGKAKNIKKRVASYFTRDNQITGKTRVLVKKIHNIRYIVVETEIDALLLENNLIKKHQPRYNVMLKDDKTFPWICIKEEPFPRVFPTRNPVRDGSQYFGPYANVKMMNTLLDLIRNIFPLRTCKYQLTEENISSGKFRVCLEYHIGNCAGPCEGLQDESSYMDHIRRIRKVLRGDISVVIRQLKEHMQAHSKRLEFEQAQVYKEKLETLEKYQSRSTVVSPRIRNVDVINYLEEEDIFYANYLRVINGAVVQSHTIELKKKLDEPVHQLLTLAITEFRQQFQSRAPQVILPVQVRLSLPDVKLIVPRMGEKKWLLDLSRRNLLYYKKEHERKLPDPHAHTRRLMNALQKDLNLEKPPCHIECFDNSNIQGEYAVAAMSVFKDGKPSKKDYRHYTLRTVSGADDYKSMEEVIWRRYKRLLDEKSTLPQLIIIDGGKGQLNAAVRALAQLNLRGQIAIIGIAKRLEEIYFPDDPVPLYLDKRSESLKVIQHARNEAHRFGIKHYRKKHEKSVRSNSLEDIPGIGKKTASLLLREFGSIARLKKAPKAAIEKVAGKSRTAKLLEYLNKGQAQNRP